MGVGSEKDAEGAGEMKIEKVILDGELGNNMVIERGDVPESIRLTIKENGGQVTIMAKAMKEAIKLLERN
jgi:ribosomal protein L31E